MWRFEKNIDFIVWSFLVLQWLVIGQLVRLCLRSLLAGRLTGEVLDVFVLLNAGG